MNDYVIIENGIVANVIVGPLPDEMEGVATHGGSGGSGIVVIRNQRAV